MISITNAAKEKIKNIIESEGLENQFLRVKVVGGGCAGMMHDLYFSADKGDEDELFDIDGIKVIIDQVSFQYLENANIDYFDKFMQSGFKITSPDATGSCGCGKSVSY